MVLAALAENPQAARFVARELLDDRDFVTAGWRKTGGSVRDGEGLGFLSRWWFSRKFYLRIGTLFFDKLVLLDAYFKTWHE